MKLSEFRAKVRENKYKGSTRSQSPGNLQANLAILPKKYIDDFLTFCRLNYQPCPILEVTEIGNPRLKVLGKDINICTDIPAYKVFKNGKHTDSCNDILKYWTDDLVGVLIGCSYSFEELLVQKNLLDKSIIDNNIVSIYVTNQMTKPYGIFSGPIVASMRPIEKKHIYKTVELCSRLSLSHGSPIHIGDPAEIGIKDIERPDFGLPCEIKPGFVPVFWGCGVTPQQIALCAKPDLMITHEPGCLLVCDIKNAETYDKTRLS